MNTPYWFNTPMSTGVSGSVADHLPYPSFHVLQNAANDFPGSGANSYAYRTMSLVQGFFARVRVTTGTVAPRNNAPHEPKHCTRFARFFESADLPPTTTSAVGRILSHRFSNELAAPQTVAGDRPVSNPYIDGGTPKRPLETADSCEKFGVPFLCLLTEEKPRLSGEVVWRGARASRLHAARVCPRAIVLWPVEPVAKSLKGTRPGPTRAIGWISSVGRGD